MKLICEYLRISDLIAAQLAETITDPENQELMDWLNSSGENRAIYDSIVAQLQSDISSDSLHDVHSIQQDWMVVKDQITRINRRQYLHRMMRYASVVAVVIVAMGLGLYLNQHSDKGVISESMKDGVSTGVVLTLSDGSQISMAEPLMTEIEEGDVSVKRDSLSLVYSALTGVEGGKVKYNTITVPRGEEFRLTLSDGTKVTLNSESELRFPLKFAIDKRTVYLKGEAYFEVTKDVRRQFRVNTLYDVSVQVLGTSFNVNAYQESGVVNTTLVQGEVEVVHNGRAVTIVPNQQAIFSAKAQNFEVLDVDVEQYVGWKDGKFVINNMSLEVLMKQIARWYNIEVEFEGEAVRELRFTGNIERYADISVLLKMLEKVQNIKCEITGNNLIIRPL